MAQLAVAMVCLTTGIDKCNPSLISMGSLECYLGCILCVRFHCELPQSNLCAAHWYLIADGLAVIVGASVWWQCSQLFSSNRKSRSKTPS